MVWHTWPHPLTGVGPGGLPLIPVLPPIPPTKYGSGPIVLTNGAWTTSAPMPWSYRPQAIDGRIDPGAKYVFLTMASENLLREIYCYRMRTGDYSPQVGTLAASQPNPCMCISLSSARLYPLPSNCLFFSVSHQCIPTT